MSKEISQTCNQLSFAMAHIIRPIDQLRAARDIYEAERNVVGVDIEQKDLNIQKLYNNCDENFEGCYCHDCIDLFYQEMSEEVKYERDM